MIVLHIIVAVVFALSGLAYGLLLGISVGHIGVLYGLCGAFGLFLSVALQLARSDMSVWARKSAQRR